MSDIQSIRFQNDEFKALQYIYLQQFHTVKESNPQKFNIECQPYTGKEGEYKIKLMFEFTPNYPHTPLKYEIQPITGITRDNMTAIISAIEEILHNNKDRPIVYDIVEETRIWIQEYLVEGKAYIKDEEMYMKKKQEVFEKPKFATFTPVTIESFTAWKKEFDARNRLKKIEKKQNEVKVTGKEYFLGKKDEIEEDSDDDEEEDEEYEGEQQQEEVQKVQIPRDDVQNNDLF